MYPIKYLLKGVRSLGNKNAFLNLGMHSQNCNHKKEIVDFGNAFP
jgi:hypothetical protein